MSAIHETFDNRNINIDFVGVKNLKLPFTFQSKQNYITIGNFKSGVFLNANKKGAHLSWIVELLNNEVANNKMSITDFNMLALKLSKILETQDVEIDSEFTILIPEITPFSKKLSHRETIIKVNTIKKEEKIHTVLEVGIYGAMACPNSKAISKYGAHSQRCFLNAAISGNIDGICVEEVAQILSESFSAPVYSLVKSVDERWMTEKAYENPKFTEDLIRDCLINLNCKYPKCSFSIEAENFESIHSHNVYAKGCINND